MSPFTESASTMTTLSAPGARRSVVATIVVCGANFRLSSPDDPSTAVDVGPVCSNVIRGCRSASKKTKTVTVTVT
jgi:hypothetical protein